MNDLEKIRDLLISVEAQQTGRWRTWEAEQTHRLINDVQLRLIPWARLTACTQCDGFRDGDVTVRPRACTHIEVTP